MDTLTPQQRAAVEDRGGGLLVSAAAGSGKTKVLVERLFRYVTEEGRDLDDFLIITYTRAAAAELRGKIAAELSRRLAADPGDAHLRRQVLRTYRADIKTVDAFCTSLLREEAHLLAGEDGSPSLSPDFRVLDEDEAALLRGRVLRRTLEAFYEDLTPGRELLAGTMGAGRDDRRLEELVLEVHGKLQSHAWPLRWLERARETWRSLDGPFDATPWAEGLLGSVRRRARHGAELLRRGAMDTEGDAALSKGYGTKFLTAAASLDPLASCQGWEEARRALGQVTFPRLSTPRGRGDEPEIRALKRVWEICKGTVKDLGKILSTSGEDAMGDLRSMAPAMDALLELVGTFSEAYRKEKARIDAADFSDQEHLALALLVGEDGSPTELGRRIAARYAEVLVDEYQDTNEVQDAIFRAVSGGGERLFAVGDVKQSIYRFRLADPGIFLEKYRRSVPQGEARPGEPRKVVLSRNFRSRREVLDAADLVFSSILSPQMGEMSYGEEEALHPGADWYEEGDGYGTELHLIAVGGTEDGGPPVGRVETEARFTARRIRELLDGGLLVTGPDGSRRPCRPEDIVILLRSPSSRTAAYRAALAERGIPCSFEERGDPFAAMETASVVSLLEVVDDPRRDVPLISALRSPIFGFTPDHLAQIRARAPGGGFYDAVRAAAEAGDRDCAVFLEELGEMRDLARDLSVHALLWAMYARWDILGVFAACDRGEERREGLLALGRLAERFERSGYKGLFAFVTQLRRLRESGRPPEGGSGSGGGGVRLMSIHRSKGLEFPVVILADLDRPFSRRDLDAPVLVHPEMGLGPRYVDLGRRIRWPTLARTAVEERLRREALAEEQRILYVGMTRPKEKLILVGAMRHAEERIGKLAASGGVPAPPETVAGARSFGDWLLLSVLPRPEAGGLLRWAGAGTVGPADGGASPYGQIPWEIRIHDGAELSAPPPPEERTEEAPSRAPASFDPDLLSFTYPYQEETRLPAKVTATQLKGRALDDEIGEGAARTPWLRPLEQPRSRWAEHGLTPAERGTAAHLALQWLDLRDRDVRSQVESMRERGLLTPEQAAAVDLRSLDRFLGSDLAEEIRRSPDVRREWPFTLLIDAPGGGGDQVLLQGVVDCCFETEAGMVVVDFKTDQVRDRAEMEERAERYRPQLTAYSEAVGRVLGKEVVRRILWFLRPGRAVEI